MRFSVVVLLVALMAGAVKPVFAESKLAVPADSALDKQIRDSIDQARAEGDLSRVQRELNRLAEMYPNDPVIRAPIYLALAQVSTELGDDAKARECRAEALAIDPDIAGWTGAGAEKTAGSKRGVTADQISSYLALGLQIYSQVQQARQQRMAAAPPAGPQPMQQPNAFPAAPVGAPGAPVPQAPLPAPGGFASPAPVVVGYDANNQPIYAQPDPSAQAQQAQQFPQPQPAQQYPQAQQPQQFPQPQQQYPQPQQPQPMQQPQPPQAPQFAQYQPAPGAAPSPYPASPAGMAAPQAQPMPQPMQQPLAASPTGYYPGSQPASAAPQPYPASSAYPAQPAYGAQPAYPSQPRSNPPQSGYGGGWATRVPPNPYGAPQGYARRRSRGEQAPPIKIFYDRSHVGDAAYFQDPCAALLAVDSEGSLTITPGCGEAPLVVPPSDIVAIRMNVAVARQVGAFHIETAKGLYLTCTGESGTRDESAEIVHALREQLHLGD